jgi:hypothetical protein
MAHSIFSQMLSRYQIAVKNDVRPFLNNPQEIKIWSTAYFLQLADMIQIEK